MNDKITILEELGEHSPNLLKARYITTNKVGKIMLDEATYFDTMQQNVMSQIAIEQITIQDREADTQGFYDGLQKKVINKVSKESTVHIIRLNIYRVAAVAAVFVLSILVVNHYFINPKVDTSKDELVSSFVQNLKEEELDVILNEYTNNKDQFNMIINSGLLDDQYASNEDLDIIPIEYINEDY